MRTWCALEDSHTQSPLVYRKGTMHSLVHMHGPTHTHTHKDAHTWTESLIDKRLTGPHRCTRKRNHHNYSATGVCWPHRAITRHLLTVFDIWLVNMVHSVVWMWQIDNYSESGGKGKMCMLVWPWQMWWEHYSWRGGEDHNSKSLNRTRTKVKALTHGGSEGTYSRLCLDGVDEGPWCEISE